MTFTQILNVSISASWLVGAILLIRLLFRKTPKAFRCALWALVAVRLLCPVLPESPMSLVPTAQVIPEEYLMMQPKDDLHQTATLDLISNPVYPEPVDLSLHTSVGQLQIRDLRWTIYWWIGMGVMGLYAVFSYLRLRLRIRTAVAQEGNVWICDDIDSPFLLGMIRPRIYLPSVLSPEQSVHVIAHEMAHIKRLDHWWKPVGFALLAIHWFNPVMWLAFILLCRDIELACDERVIRSMDKGSVRAYSEALLACSMRPRFVAACPLAFGEVGVRERIQSVLSYKKPGFWLVLGTTALAVILVVCFVTNPAQTTIGTLREDTFYALFTQTEALTFRHGTAGYTTDTVADVVARLKSVRLSSTPVSKSRAEDRDRTYEIIDGNTILCVSGDFSEIWVDNGVKPSFSYRVKDPAQLQAVLSRCIPGIDMNVLPFAGTYVSCDCLYMNALSDYVPFGGDSREVYHFTENSFTMESRIGTVTVYDPVNWDWKRVDWKAEPFSGLNRSDLLPGNTGFQDWIGADGLYQKLDESHFLLYGQERLLLVETTNMPGSGCSLWSVYRLVPEYQMGQAEWTFDMLRMTEYPAFRFGFDLEYTHITASTAGGRLCSYDEPSANGYPAGQTLEYPAGAALYWCPLDEHGMIDRNATVRFVVYNGTQAVLEGTLYITGTDGGYRMIRDGEETIREVEPAVYTARLVGAGLRLAQNLENSGGIIQTME